MTFRQAQGDELGGAATGRPAATPFPGAVPRSVWILALGVAALHAIPFLLAARGAAEPGYSPIPVGYNAKDFLQYVALVREAAERPSLFLSNPFTLGPEEGRFLLLVHSALGLVSRFTGIDPFLVFELSRPPLLLAFFALLWRTSGSFLRDRRSRVAACWLAGAAGGWGTLARWLLPAGASPLVDACRRDLWYLFGWSGFASLHNPLWIAALCIVLGVLPSVLGPSGVSGPGPALRTLLGALALWAVHAYSAIVLLGILVLVPLARRLCGRECGGRRLGYTAAVLAGFAAAAGPLALWQRKDPAFLAASGNVFGPQDLSVFWYPVAVGLPALFAFVGLRERVEERDEALPSLLAWLGAVVFLHSSPVLNGYHFVFHLFLPLALLAATPLARLLERLERLPSSLPRVGLVAALGVGSLADLSQASVDVFRDASAHAVPTAVLEALGNAPPGPVLSPVGIGNALPALAGRRVFAGHWFLTPEARRTSAFAESLTRDPSNAGHLAPFLDRNGLAAAVVTDAVAETALKESPGRLTRAGGSKGLAVLVRIGTRAGAGPAP